MAIVWQCATEWVHGNPPTPNPLNYHDVSFHYEKTQQKKQNKTTTGGAFSVCKAISPDCRSTAKQTHIKQPGATKHCLYVCVFAQADSLSFVGLSSYCTVHSSLRKKTVFTKRQGRYSAARCYMSAQLQALTRSAEHSSGKRVLLQFS